LVEIAALGGIFPELRAERLQQSAQIVCDDFAGDLNAVLSLDLVQARKALAKFPMIGEPGAEKILLLCRVHAQLAPESNALRVLGRLGFVRENKNYSTMYRDARRVLGLVIGREGG